MVESAPPLPFIFLISIQSNGFLRGILGDTPFFADPPALLDHVSPFLPIPIHTHAFDYPAHPPPPKLLYGPTSSFLTSAHTSTQIHTHGSVDERKHVLFAFLSLGVTSLYVRLSSVNHFFLKTM